MWLFNSLKSVRGDVVVITGGAMGLGRLLALKFAKLGARVVIWDLHDDLGAQVVAEIKALGVATPRAYYYKVDVTDRAAVYATAKLVIAQLGGVDMLINNAGIVSGRPLLEQSEHSDALAAKTMDVNATAHIWTIKAFLPGMVQRNKGHVVSIASAAGVFGCGGMVDYSASKFAAVGIMVSLRQELQAMGKYGVHCTLVCPSFIKTGMFEGVQPPLFTTWLTPEYAAESIVRAVRRNQWRLLMPSVLYLVEMIAALLPDFVGQWLIRVTRVAQAMKHFQQTRTVGKMLIQADQAAAKKEQDAAKATDAAQ